MAPTKRADEAAPGDARPITSKVWVMLAIVFAGVCVLGVVAGLVARRYRKRREYRELAEKDSPTVSEPLPERKTSSTFRSDDGDGDDQGTRNHQPWASRVSSQEGMLPSREVLSTAGQLSNIEERATEEVRSQDRDRGELTPLESPIGLVNDWKRWEAKLRQDKSRSLIHHPGFDASHPSRNQTAPMLPTACVPARRPVATPTGMVD